MGNLQVGAAMRKISPTQEILDLLKKDGGHTYEGIYEDIWVRTIVVSDGNEKVLICGMDGGSFYNSFATAARIEKEFGIPNDHCIFSATHNHECPGADLKEGGDPKFKEMRKPSDGTDTFGKFIIDRIVESTAEAISKLQPARMGAIKGESYINVCRDLPTPMGGMQMNNFQGNNDHQLLVIAFEDLQGEPIAVYINHPTHSNYMVWNLYDQSLPMVNNDVGGGISRFVEKAYKNQIVAVWAKGAAGDQNPITRSSWRIINVDDNGEFSMEQVVFDYKDNLAQMKALCCTQGLEVLDLIKQIDTWTDEFSYSFADTKRSIPARVSYTELYGRGGGTPRDTGKPGQKFSSFGVSLKCGELPEPVPYDPPRTIDYYLRLANLCGFAFVNLNSESYCNLGKLIRSLVPAEFTAVQGVTWGSVGYIPDSKGEWINGFGAANTNAWSGAMTEEAYTDAMKELVGKVYA